MKKRSRPALRSGPLAMPTIAHIADAELVEHALRDAELPLAAIDQHQIGPAALLALGVLLQGAGEAAQQHLAHHRVIVAARDSPRASASGAASLSPLVAAGVRGSPFLIATCDKARPRIVNLR